MNKPNPAGPVNSSLIAPILLLVVVLVALFWRSFLPDHVHFSNDGPLGQQMVHWQQMPGAMTGMWDDLNDVGFPTGAFTASVRTLLYWSLGPVGYSKFYAPVSLFILGIGVLAFLRALKFTSFGATLGMLAAILNSIFLAGACWGIASVEIAIGMDFFALALAFSNHRNTPALTYWLRLILAGLCVGVNVIEGADVGALCSLLVAIAVVFKTLFDSEGGWMAKIIRACSQVLVIAVFAGFIATQTILSLVGTSIQGVAGTAQDAETKAQHWDFATQWSLPKKETLSLIVPGLFGYKMDTPKDMTPALQNAYRGGVYWGGVGRDPALDRFIDSGNPNPLPAGLMRFSGGGGYCGVLVMLIAAWAAAQSFRREKSPFLQSQKKLIWFWLFVLIVSLPLAWGRFAPGSHSSNDFLFYALLYKLPYFSTIRNPAKFLAFFSWAIVILFAYGVQALSRQLDETAPKSASLLTQLENWWKRAGLFDRRWIFACGGIFGISVIGWFIFSAEQPTFVQYLQKMGFPDETMAREIGNFSLGQVTWFLALLAASIGALTLVIAGYFSGTRARFGIGLLGAILIFDLGRANLPYIVHWDYKQKYEVGSLNPVVEFLRDKPYEHRVAGLPFRAPEGMELLDQVYRIEWMQHHFPYYNIQCLDLIQMPRMAEDLKTYLEALSPRGTQASAPLFTRRWQLSNTRYLLGAAGYLEVMNQQLDPVQKRFRIVQRFEIAPKPGILNPQRLEELTAVPADNGRYALFEFTGALPRAKLYSNWQVNTNDAANLKTLADLDFDPVKTVLISTPQKDLPTSVTGENSGTVEFTSYAPKKIVFTANATAPSVLLLNDKFDPHWRVTVDGKPAELLRCNYLMRGVQVPPGQHTVAFTFSLPSKPMYVTLAGFAIGLGLCGFLLFSSRRPQSNSAN